MLRFQRHSFKFEGVQSREEAKIRHSMLCAANAVREGLELESGPNRPIGRSARLRVVDAVKTIRTERKCARQLLELEDELKQGLVRPFRSLVFENKVAYRMAQLGYQGSTTRAKKMGNVAGINKMANLSQRSLIEALERHRLES